MTDQLTPTVSMEEAIHEAIAKFETSRGNGLEAGDILSLTRVVTDAIAVYVTSLTHEEYLAFARTLLHQSAVYAAYAHYPVHIQGALTRAHHELLIGDKPDG